MPDEDEEVGLILEKEDVRNLLAEKFLPASASDYASSCDGLQLEQGI